MIKGINRNLSILGLALMASVPASADVVNFLLVNPPQLAAPGTDLSFMATVSAPLTNSAPVFLTADSASVDGPLTLDDSGYFDSFPESLNPGTSFTGVLFTVDVPTSVTLLNSYAGYFEVDGGVSSSAADFLASVSFRIEAVPASAVPEPRSLVLLLVGLAGMATVLRRKRSSQ